MRKLLQIAVLIASLAFACWVLVQADLPGAWRQLASSTSNTQRVLLVALFLFPSLCTHLVETHGWVATFGRKPLISFRRLFCIRLAGEAVNQATPLGGVGGEPVKAVLAAEKEAGMDSAASVTAAKFVMTVAQVTYVLIALVLAAPRFAGHPGALFGFALFPGGIGLLMAVLLVLYVLVPAGARRRLVEHPRLMPFQDGIRVVGRVLGFWKTHPRQCAAALAAFFCGWSAAAGEFWLVARVLDLKLAWWEAFAMEGLMNSITMATFFIPGNLGSQEAGLLYMARLFAVGGPFGAVMVVLRRAREVFWVGVGFACLAVLGGGAVSRVSGTAKLAGSETP